MLDYYGRIVVLDSPGEGDDRELDVIGKWLVGRLETLKPGPDLLDVRWVDGTHDDDPDHPFTNEFRVIALARGRLVEHPDPFLSPVIPTIEDPVEID